VWVGQPRWEGPLGCDVACRCLGIVQEPNPLISQWCKNNSTSSGVPYNHGSVGLALGLAQLFEVLMTFEWLLNASFSWRHLMSKPSLASYRSKHLQEFIGAKEQCNVETGEKKKIVWPGPCKGRGRLAPAEGWSFSHWAMVQYLSLYCSPM
jgi:hypothetical protein